MTFIKLVGPRVFLEIKKNVCISTHLPKGTLLPTNSSYRFGWWYPTGTFKVIPKWVLHQPIIALGSDSNP